MVFDINILQIAIYKIYKLLYNTNNTTLQPQHNYPTRTQDNLTISTLNLTLYQHYLFYPVPKTWNAVYQQLKTIQT